MNIGSYQFASPLILAPMAGVTDLPYRNLCRQLGAGAAVGEMLTSKQELWNSPKSSFRQIQPSEQGIRWIQILGNDPQQMALAALQCEQDGAHIIDINMGCPAKKVCKKLAGSALLQDEKLVAQILEAVVKTVDVPVTLKIRTGAFKQQKNFLNIGVIAEQCGVSAVSIHGRTRQCKYTEQAEYESAAYLKQKLEIPVIVNGDIVSAEKAKTVLDHTNADGIMVGRAALGNPWLFREIGAYLDSTNQRTSYAPSLEELHQTISTHIKSLHDFYGTSLGVRISRKHLSWYEEKFPHIIFLKKQFNQLNESQAQLDLIDEYFGTGFGINEQSNITRRLLE